MRVIGILGGVASGKSLVAGEFTRLGAGVLDADQAGHEVLRLPKIEAAARARGGDGICGADGHIDRGRLARIVFAPSCEAAEERSYLEQLTHPEIGHRLAAQLGRMEAAGKTVAVLDAPLLLETGWDRLCDCLVFVEAPPEVRLARAGRRGWSREDFQAREGAQDALEEKRRRAQFVIDNSGSLEQTQSQVANVWRSVAG